MSFEMFSDPSPLYSVVIPCHNSSKTLYETLLSVLTQTCQDFEIIVVDDGSTPEEARKIREYCHGDARIRRIRQKNCGVSIARNTGLKAARGLLVALLDADDLWDADHLAVHAARMDNDPELGISFCPVRFIEADGSPTRERSRPKLAGLTPAEMLATNPCTTCSTIVFRREILDDAGYFSEHLRRAEDQEWLFRVSLTHWKIEGVNRILVSYRNSPKGLSSSLEGMYQGYEDMLASARQYAPELVERLGPLASARMQRYLARRALRLGLPKHVARSFLRRALLRSPAMVLHEPKQTLGTMVAAWIPGASHCLMRRM